MLGPPETERIWPPRRPSLHEEKIAIGLRPRPNDNVRHHFGVCRSERNGPHATGKNQPGQAEKIALTKVPKGKIRSAELENACGPFVCSFDIAKSGSRDITEVLVNAKTGKIISVSTETPVDPAQEMAADHAALRQE